MRLRPGSGVLGMSVSDATNLGEGSVEFQMCGEIGRRTKFAIDDLTFEVADDHMFRLQLIVGNAAGLDRYQTLIAVNPARISEGIEDEALPN